MSRQDISELLFELSLSIEFEITSLMQKDSLDLPDEDRELILDKTNY